LPVKLRPDTGWKSAPRSGPRAGSPCHDLAEIPGGGTLLAVPADLIADATSRSACGWSGRGISYRAAYAPAPFMV